MFIPSIKRNVSICFVFAALHLSTLVGAQAINPDLIDFTKISIWVDLKTCLQSCFGGYGIGYQIGCKTNACLCRPDTLGDAIGKVAASALVACSALQDQTSATSILIDYCSAKGSTSIIYPTILAPTGSCTATTVYRTIYSTVYRNDSYSTQAVILGRGFEVFVAMLFLSIGTAMILL